RYLEEDFKGTFMNQPFSGLGIDGYDNARKKFFFTWVDTMGTGLIRGEGTCDTAACKVINFTSMETDPATGKERKERTVLRIDGENKHTLEMYGSGAAGKEYKMMENVYTRKGASAAQ